MAHSRRHRLGFVSHCRGTRAWFDGAIAYHLPRSFSIDAPHLLWAVFLVWVVYALSFLVRSQRRSIPRAVICLIAGIALLDALAIAAAEGAPGPIALALGGFALTLLFQRYVPGT